MPLPQNNTPWLPEPWDEAQAQYQLNEAWYLGDVDALAKHYGSSVEQRPSHMVKGQGMVGGVMGALSRFFWGRPVPLGQNRTRLHVPAPSDLAVLSADLLYAEPPEVRLADADKTAQQRADLIVNTPEAHATWNTMGELKAVFGAAALVTKWNSAVSDTPWLQTVAADLILPEFTDGKPTAITMWTEYREGQTYLRHLERHERGYIVHALYRGTKDNLGVMVPLEELPQTEAITRLEGLIWQDGVAAIPTGVPWLTADYTINMPSRVWRRKGDLRFAGRSDYQGILPLFDALDEVWSSWVRDIRLARARLVVPESYLDSGGPGSAASFDVDREIFSAVNSLTRPGEAGMEMHQPQIRVEEHEATVYGLYREILRAAGYSPSSWGDSHGQGSRQMTATEVHDRDRASERTRDKKALYDREAIARQTRVALAIDEQVFRGKGGKQLTELPTVSFPPASQVDPLRTSQTIAHLRAAQVITTKTAVEMAHPDWDPERVDQEVDGLLQEQGQVPDPTINPADYVNR